MKRRRAAHTRERPFVVNFYRPRLAVVAGEDCLGGVGGSLGRRLRAARLHLLRVILDEGLEVAVAPRSVEVVLLHLRVDLVVTPAVLLEAVDRAHRARAVAATGAVYEELAGRGVVNRLQERRDPFWL